MRIIGGRDYYDNALSHGIDKTVVFNRKNIYLAEKDIPDNILLSFPSLDIRIYDMVFYPIQFFVAGKIYTGFMTYDICTNNKPINVYWTLHSLKEKLGDLYYEIPKYKIASIVNFYNLTINKNQLNYLIKNKITILTIYCEYMTYPDWGMRIAATIDGNDLGRFQFYKVLDPYTAFQEISMWVGGVLTNNPPEMVEIKDERVILAKHGMDHTSFRKPKQVSK